MQASAFGERGLRVQWSSPALEGGDELDRYEVRLSGDQDSDARVFQVSSDVTMSTFHRCDRG